ncbi:DUF4976 domain-containing protein [Oceanispirochaeta sp. M1]|nr:DUF4976 domain-containing protein [Oceanispirochaeta sp. M1]
MLFIPYDNRETLELTSLSIRVDNQQIHDRHTINIRQTRISHEGFNTAYIGKYHLDGGDYFGCNSFVDAQIGRVLEAVEKYAPHALIIYTSDHGDSLGSHGFISKGPSMYEETTNIPFIVRWPGESPENESSESLVSHIDLVPTVLDYAGLAAPKTLEGKSLLKLFRDKDAAVNNEVFIEYGRYEVDLDGFGGFQPIRCVFDGRYKLVINLLETDELYDLSEDSAEEINLIENKLLKEIRNSLHDRLLEWMNESRDPFRGYHWECRPWRDDARKPSYMYTAMTRQKFPEHGEKIQLDYAHRNGDPGVYPKEH